MQAQFVPVDSIRPMRHAVLRQGLPFETTLFDGDHDPDTYHVAISIDDQIVAVGTMVKRPWSKVAQGFLPDDTAYQVRGMAVSEKSRGTGSGKKVLEILENKAKELGARTIWCNARSTAIGFYKKAGWHIVGDEFEIETVGPHFAMVKRLA